MLILKKTIIFDVKSFTIYIDTSEISVLVNFSNVIYVEKCNILVNFKNLF